MKLHAFAAVLVLAALPACAQTQQHHEHVNGGTVQNPDPNGAMHQTAGGMPPHHHDKPAVPSTSLAVTYMGKTTTLTLANLRAMPQTTVSVHNAHSNTDETYAGPLVTELLARAGLAFSEKTEHPILHTYVVATGADAYYVIYSGAELQPGLHKAQAIVAISKAGQPLTTTGQFQLVDTLDVTPARWVRNLNALTVVEAPAPGK